MNENFNKELWDAVENADIDLTRKLLDSGGDINARDKSGNTFLHLAAEMNCLEMCRLLLEREADVNATNTMGKTPLIKASKVETVVLLKENGAHVNAKDNFNFSALDYSVIDENSDVCLALVSYNADTSGAKPKSKIISDILQMPPYKASDKLERILTEPSMSSVDDRANWIAEMTILRALTNLRDTGKWENDIKGTDIKGAFNSNNIPGIRAIKADEVLKDPHECAWMIRRTMSIEIGSVAYEWEKRLETPIAFQSLGEFARDVMKKIGTAYTNVMPEIEKLAKEIKLEQDSRNLTSGYLFKQLSRKDVKPNSPSCNL